MDLKCILVMFCLLMTSSSQPWKPSGILDRRQPPPFASFLDQLLKIHKESSSRTLQEPRLGAGERLVKWEQLERTRSQQNLFRSSISGHRLPRHLLASPSMRGCHLGTCQVQNLASLLYRYGGNTQKDESHKNNKGTSDPMGYGRRRRRAVGHRVSTPT